MHNYVRHNCNLCRDTSFCQIQSVLETAECVAVSQDTLFWQTHNVYAGGCLRDVSQDTLFWKTRIGPPESALIW